MDSVLVVVYSACVGLLALWGLHRLALWRGFRGSVWFGNLSGGPPPAAAHGDPGDLPQVTVQLPIFNERTVVERLIHAAGALDYPADRLEIQVLDDSLDETRDLAAQAVAVLRARGLDAIHLFRSDRTGFKAGALDAGMRRAKGELIAVFDADFVPPPDFLRRLVGEFRAPGVGMVQARWGHLNRDDSPLTRAQATLLDGHFVIEHTARAAAGLFFNFNGTAGIWRRTAIDDAGGWQHDTLTEDLDLSYRAQLAGWRFVYRPDVVAPAELPADVAAFKGQQRRWARGSAQVLRKLGPSILRSPQPLRVKVEAIAHLAGNVGYPLVLLLAISMPVAIQLRGSFGHLLHGLGFLVCTGSVVLFYGASQAALGRSRRNRWTDVPVGIAAGVGMAISQTEAVARGLFQRAAGVFVRTPKRGDGARRAYSGRLAELPGLELLLALWIAVATVDALRLGRWGALPFLLLFLAGFGWIGWLSLRDALRGPRDQAAVSAA
ncbi:glycosyltransferase [Engelhardtia mirabilis]|uniref:Beta-monoglucosyldiacylglycerol synthase n=1 Tax=Engelhardtia mirabilis TaxID=2528011 RepID=A0A518BT23_9BACT|nr:Beta-monoglucosyldiacylglycerol synthase [Planctomycetes bacterium Pla133]QDV04430.1 Beta-monoglucosyldiacylglycerol synthase [Planctomycetes bacterium Pla86]